MSADPIAKSSGWDHFTKNDVDQIIRAVSSKCALSRAQAEALLEDLRATYHSYRIWNGVDQSSTKNEMQDVADSLRKATILLDLALMKVHSNKAVEKHLVKELSYVLYNDVNRTDLDNVDAPRFLAELEDNLRVLSGVSDTLAKRIEGGDLVWRNLLPPLSIRPAAEAKLIAADLPAIYERYFNSKFGISKVQDKPGGPGIRFIQSVLAMMDVRNARGEAFTPDAIAAKFKPARRPGYKRARKT
jgi:hypothetical protein